MVQDGAESLVIDPFKLSHDAKADYVLLSHEHFDHCNSEDLKKGTEAGFDRCCSSILQCRTCKGITKRDQDGKAWR